MSTRTSRAALMASMVSLVAWADDPKADSVTVLPWTNSAVTLTPKGNRGNIEWSKTFEDRKFLQSVYANVSAPLDTETRIAAFTSENKLVSGFAGLVQLGLLDGRADHGRELRETIERLDRLVASLQLIPEVAARGDLASFAKKNAILGTDSAVLGFFLTRHHFGVENAALKENPLQRIAMREAAQLKARLQARLETDQNSAEPPNHTMSDDADARFVKLAVAQLEKAEMAQGASPSSKQFRELAQSLKALHACESDLEPGCFFFVWAGDVLVRDEAFAATERLFRENPYLWEDIAPCLSGELSKITDKSIQIQTIVDQRRELLMRLPNLKSADVLARRDLSLTSALAQTRHVKGALSLDIAASYDALKVYQDDLAAAPTRFHQYQLTAGATGSLYLPLGMSINLRAAYQHKRESGAKKSNRCAALASTSSAISGQQCDANTLFRVGAAPPEQNTAQARIAFTWQYLGGESQDKVIPGAEIRAGVDGLGGVMSVGGRISIFATPVLDRLGARTGVALDLSCPINPSDSSQKCAVTPMAFFGVTLADALTN